MVINDYNLANKDEGLKMFHGKVNLPSTMKIFIETSIYSDIPKPCIIDYVKLNQIDFLFIPIIPKAIEKYEFFDLSKKMNEFLM